MNKLRRLTNLISASYYLSRLKRDQWKDFQQLRNIQFNKLKAIIKHAYNYVPYYHRLLSSAKIQPEDIRNYDDVRKIPLTSRQDIQKNYTDIIAKGVDASKFPSSVTTGSSGIPSKFVSDYSHLNHVDATGRYTFFECGVKLSNNFVTVWGRGTQSIVWGKKYARLLGYIRNSVVPLFPEETLINILRQIDPDVISTFPSLLSTLANHDVSGINPRLLFTQGEPVTQHCRDLVKKSFHSELFETYGSVEFGHLAFECDEHCGLHMITNGAYIEFIDEDGEHVSPGEQGEIIVTGLYNRVMPLIRYRIGDSGVPTDEKCPCGRSWPLIKEIQGRIEDYLILPSGRKLSWLYLVRHSGKEITKNVFAITQYQIIQERKDRIIFKVIKGKEFDPKMFEKIKNNIETHFAERGENLEVIIQIVKELPAARTGKKRLFISMLK